MSGKFSYDSASDGLGVMLNVNPEWGRSILAEDNVLRDDSILTEDLDSNMHASGARIDAEVGCSLPLWEGQRLLNPYGGILLSETQENKYRAGVKLSIRSNIELELEGSHTLSDGRTEVDELKLGGSNKG